MLKICLSIMVISVIFIGIGSASDSDSSRDESLNYYLPDYGAKTFDSLKADSNVIEIRGVVPEITEDKEKKVWLNRIGTSMRLSKDKIMPYTELNGQFVSGFGINYGGYCS
ncbi:hypothetical protein PV02_06965 [Methanolobus chelungpuianus]|uniref:Uncharacterized protein n=2 Tax=Methanolobus chelungpuianus TaxID=502115 RepID=A0AAE3KXH9_9EURY|nr:hypothetical protein [Methanolobus chelungpuianus]